MPLSEETRNQERNRIAAMVLDLIRERGAEISYATAQSESGLTRSRFEWVFADYDDLVDAIASVWLADHIAVMEEVVACDLPSNRKLYEFIRRRFVISRERLQEDPQFFTMVCEMGAANFDKVRSYVDLADHYLCEVIVQAQDDGYLAGLEIEEALSLLNQMLSNYMIPDALVQLGDKLTEDKLARIVDTIFIGLSAEVGEKAKGVNTIRIAAS